MKSHRMFHAVLTELRKTAELLGNANARIFELNQQVHGPEPEYEITRTFLDPDSVRAVYGDALHPSEVAPDLSERVRLDGVDLKTAELLGGANQRVWELNQQLHGAPQEYEIVDIDREASSITIEARRTEAEADLIGRVGFASRDAVVCGERANGDLTASPPLGGLTPSQARETATDVKQGTVRDAIREAEERFLGEVKTGVDSGRVKTTQRVETTQVLGYVCDRTPDGYWWVEERPGSTPCSHCRPITTLPEVVRLATVELERIDRMLDLPSLKYGRRDRIEQLVRIVGMYRVSTNPLYTPPTDGGE